MKKNEAASNFRLINWLLAAALSALAMGILLCIAGGLAGASSHGARETFMTAATYVFIASLACSVISLKLTSSLPEGEYREITAALAWRWKPWLCVSLGFTLLLASAGFSV